MSKGPSPDVIAGTKVESDVDACPVCVECPPAALERATARRGHGRRGKLWTLLANAPGAAGSEFMTQPIAHGLAAFEWEKTPELGIQFSKKWTGEQCGWCGRLLPSVTERYSRTRPPPKEMAPNLLTVLQTRFRGEKFLRSSVTGSVGRASHFAVQTPHWPSF
jgi:hypothetical protein